MRLWHITTIVLLQLYVSVKTKLHEPELFLRIFVEFHCSKTGMAAALKRQRVFDLAGFWIGTSEW